MQTPGRMKQVTAAVLLLICGCDCRANATANGQEADNALAVAAILNKPFSAIRFSRAVHTESDGRPSVTQDLGHLLLARDADGRIAMVGADTFGRNCDMPKFGTLPPCESWRQFIFDPKVGRIWHWLDGPLGHGSQVIKIALRRDQIEEAERLTSVLKAAEAVQSPQSGVFIQRLGERTFNDISAVGVRTITSNSTSTKDPILTFHEVWTSVAMWLVIRVIDGDTRGNETTSGLEHISVAPDATLFKVPQREVLLYNEAGTEDDFLDLEKW